MLDLLATQVNESFSELGAVFREAELAGSCLEGHSRQVKTDASGDTYLEVVDAYALPFAVPTAGAAMWKLVSSNSLNVGSGSYQVCTR